MSSAAYEAHPGCPFCIANGKVAIIEQTSSAYLIATLDGDGKIEPDCYFIIPKAHTTSVLELPDDWWGAVKQLLQLTPGVCEGTAFNAYHSEGRDAGQRVAHVHLWVKLRMNEKGKPSYQLGPNACIKALNGDP